MPIIIPREGSFYIDPNAITQEQRNKYWEQIVKNWVRNNPDKLLEIAQEDQTCDQITTE